MAKIRKIMCCCGSGLGSSLMVQMNIEKALKNLGIEGVEADHTSLSLLFTVLWQVPLSCQTEQ